MQIFVILRKCAGVEELEVVTHVLSQAEGFEMKLVKFHFICF